MYHPSTSKGSQDTLFPINPVSGELIEVVKGNMSLYFCDIVPYPTYYADGFFPFHNNINWSYNTWENIFSHCQSVS